MSGARAHLAAASATGQARRPPTPRGVPVLRSALDLRRDPLGTFLRARREHGDVLRFVAGPPGLRQSFVIVFHPDAVQRVVSRGADRYRKDNLFYVEVRELLGEGLLTSQDERWRRQRRLLQPAFTRQRVAGYVPLMADEARSVAARWRDAAQRGTGVDLHAEMVGLTLRIVSRALFGESTGRALPVIRRELPVLGRYVRRRGFAPARVPRDWPTPANREAARARRALSGACDEVVAHRRGSTAAADDLLGALLAVRGEDGRGLDDREIGEQVLVFLLAGHDTTGLALAYALHLLGRHPAAQQRVRREAREVLDGEVPDAEAVGRLAYTAMVLQEAMRIYPPVYGFGRRVTDGDRLGPYAIAPGTDVLVCPWVTHRHPGFWDDPERFDPERFAPAHAADRHPYAYFPFGGGPRACIGRHFALLEGTLALATILRDVQVATPADHVPLDPQITLHPAGAMPATLVAAP